MFEGIVRPTPPPAPWAEQYFTVGVTGTNGKTSTTTFIAQALRAAGCSVLLETTLEYRLNEELLELPRAAGEYLRALEIAAQAGARHAAIEVTSEALARGAAKRWRFDAGVFTNLTHEHLTSHGSWEHYIASKAQLFVHLGPGATAVFNACDESSLLLDRVTPPDVVRRWYAVETRGKPVRAANLAAAAVRIGTDGTHIDLAASPLAEAFEGTLSTQLIGRVFAENVLAAALGALSAVDDFARVKEGIAKCSTLPGRFEILAQKPTVAVDYAHTPDALARTADTAREIADASGGRVFFVFGAGGGRDAPKREPMGREVGARADYVIVTNDNPRFEDPEDIARAVAAGCCHGGRAEVHVVLDRRAAIAEALDRARPGDVVVVAGKGHEGGQSVREQTLPFSDAEVIRELLGSD